MSTKRARTEAEYASSQPASKKAKKSTQDVEVTSNFETESLEEEDFEWRPEDDDGYGFSQVVDSGESQENCLHVTIIVNLALPFKILSSRAKAI